MKIGNTIIEVKDPYKIKLPREGMLQLYFVDVSPIPSTAKPLSKNQFHVLLSHLINDAALDIYEMEEHIDDPTLEAKCAAVGRIQSWIKTHPMTESISVLRRYAADPEKARARCFPHFCLALLACAPSPDCRPRASSPNQHFACRPPRPHHPAPPQIAVRDMANFIEVMRFFAMNHYITSSQLVQLIDLLPPTADRERVDLVVTFWARVVDRAFNWTDVLRAMLPMQQVAVAQVLGYYQCLNLRKPNIHYRLRMWRNDEMEVGRLLYKLMLSSRLDNFKEFVIDEVPKPNLIQDESFWTVMIGSAATGDMPKCLIEFDFYLPPDAEVRKWAAKVVASAFKALAKWRRTGMRPGQYTIPKPQPKMD